MFAENIKINDNVTLSTEDPNDPDGANDIVFRARRIGTAELENLSPLLVLNKSVSIDVGANATLTGGGIFLIAQAEDRTYQQIMGISRLDNSFLISPLASQVTNLAAPCRSSC